ncbi:DeoR/GlpR family DNA-binding transcription regulator [uncultured Jannaschia sp.]|uniref:DeoR/GlpR family DNA-binding transcription regulator n=1 Tax=uncultured Jannaschia sp. TaxID=293347 RepID=UPI00261A3E2F|nr:DeoR/GlpR family DNA-binding transcription regulator [uncultured Jannaschia sp.]
MSDERESDLLPAERRDHLIAWFRENAAASSQELARRFNTSISTIRRDLDRLAAEGIVRRTHGGAVRVRNRATDEMSTDVARRTAVEERAAIVSAAMALISNEDSILIDTGATPHAMATEIAQSDLSLTVVTNDLFVASTLSYKPGIRLIVPGGSVRFGSYTLTGEPGSAFLSGLYCDRYFMAPHAIDLSVISDTTLEVAQLRAKMMSAARETICLADSSRLSARALYRIASIDQVSQVITDDNLSADERDRFEQAGIKLTVAETSRTPDP